MPARTIVHLVHVVHMLNVHAHTCPPGPTELTTGLEGRKGSLSLFLSLSVHECLLMPHNTPCFVHCLVVSVRGKGTTGRVARTSIGFSHRGESERLHSNIGENERVPQGPAREVYDSTLHACVGTKTRRLALFIICKMFQFYLAKTSKR